MAADGKLLRIYLNDHLAGATVGVELARRALRANRGSELGSFLAELVSELEEDRRSLERLLAELDVPKSAVKQGAAVVAERLGRLKLNGRLTGYSDLSRLLDLEGLVVLVRAKRGRWRNLREATDVASRAPAVDLDALVARAEEQLEALERHRIAAARRALAA